MNFPANGDLTESQILKIKLKAEQMWTDSQLSQEYVPYSDTALAVLKNQTARFKELENPDRDNEVVVNFINPCGIEVSDAVSDCEIDGQELGTGGLAYKLDILKSTPGLKINIEKFRTNYYTYEEFTAAGILLHTKALDEFWSQQLLAKLKSFAGINVAVASNGVASNGFSFANNSTGIPANAFDVRLLTVLQQQAIINKMPAGYIIDRGWLYQPIENAKIDAGNNDGKGDGTRAARLDGRVAYDQFNFDKAGINDVDTFIVAPGAVAFKTRARYRETPNKMDAINRTEFKIKSRLLPGVEYDVTFKMECVDNPVTKIREILHKWSFRTEGGIFLNPNGCPTTINGTTYTPTGVTAYNRVAA